MRLIIERIIRIKTHGESSIQVRPVCLLQSRLHREDVSAILDDLSDAFLIHCDIRPTNFVRAPTGTRPCPKHNCVHKFYIIDFAWMLADDNSWGADKKLPKIRRRQRFSSLLK